MSTDALTIRPGVAGIVFNSDDELLLHRRRAGDGWAPPSGSMEPGEDVKSAFRRELHEETRLRVDVARFVGLYSDPSFQIVRYPSGKTVHFVTSVFACRKAGGDLQGAEEGFEWRWFAPDGLPDVMPPYARHWIDDSLSKLNHPVVR
ncbi:NUDIX domain-containing protein [Longibacter sp.]|uniref:NUDIX domain-containing protein n=1 Tax=Longibacter sp. TaxID=2045415 RepID=UPI003EBE0BD2